MYNVQRIGKSHEHVNLRGVNGEMKRKEKWSSHQWIMKKGVESRRCIGVGMGQKKEQIVRKK